MAGRRELERRLNALGDIDAILGVMKNLALLESGKLFRVLAPQREMVAGLERSAADFLTFYPRPQPAAASLPMLLLIGSERGFCSDFNDLLLAALPAAEGGNKPARLAVGAKLAGRVAADIQLEGAHAVEEIEQVIHKVMDAIGTLVTHTAGGRTLQLLALHHDPDRCDVVLRQLTPCVGAAESAAKFIFPPQLNISPDFFFARLAEQHLLATITEVFHRSLMAECRFRLNHIEGASRRMERRITELKRKQTLARQEEIIEEIEAILAGAGMVATEGADRF